MKECLINSKDVDIRCRRNNLFQTGCLLAGSMHVMICLLWKPESTVFSILILILNLILCKCVRRQSRESYYLQLSITSSSADVISKFHMANNWYYIDMYWGCLSHKLDARGAVALKVCSLSQIFPLVTLIAGIGYNTLHVHVFLLRFAIMIFRFPFLTVQCSYITLSRAEGLPKCPPDIRWSSIEYKASLLLYTI